MTRLHDDLAPTAGKSKPGWPWARAVASGVAVAPGRLARRDDPTIDQTKVVGLVALPGP